MRVQRQVKWIVVYVKFPEEYGYVQLPCDAIETWGPHPVTHRGVELFSSHEVALTCKFEQVSARLMGAASREGRLVLVGLQTGDGHRLLMECYVARQERMPRPGEKTRRRADEYRLVVVDSWSTFKKARRERAP